MLCSANKKPHVIPVEAVPDDAYVVEASYMGAPTVGIEKLDSNQAQAAALAVLQVHSSKCPCAVLSNEPGACALGVALDMASKQAGNAHRKSVLLPHTRMSCCPHVCSLHKYWLARKPAEQRIL